MPSARYFPQGPFLPPALPGFISTTGLSATPYGPACPSQTAGGHVPCHRRGFPCRAPPPPPCVPPPLPRRKQPVLASLASRPIPAFPGLSAGRLPHHPSQSRLGVPSRYGPACARDCASSSWLSKPARRSLALRPAGSPSAFATPLIGVLPSLSLPPSTAPAATGWSDSSRAGFAPAKV